MKLRWKYIFIVNLFTILAMSIFFIIDDRKARDDLEGSQVNDLVIGANIHKVAELVGRSVQDIIDLSQSPENLEKRIQQELVLLKGRKELADVIDIHITDKTGTILGSLTGEEVGNKVNINDEVRDAVAQDEIHISGLAKYHDEYTTAVIVPYTAEASVINNKGIELEPGLIQILFSASGVVKAINAMRLRHLLYVLGVSFALGILISISTVSMVDRPIRGLIKFITRAKEGSLDVLPTVSYSGDEIGRLAYELDRMLREIQTAHEKRIAALGRLAGGVAHEIKNPLNLLGLAALNLKELLSAKQMKPEEVSEARECVDRITNHVARLSKITEQFLQLTRPGELDIRQVDLDMLVDGVIAEFMLTLDKANIKVITNYCKQLNDVQVDPSKMRQALFNIIQNSIQAMHRSGKIYVKTSRVKTAAGDRAAIEIRDTGMGIPEHIQDRIFDAYFTTRENEGGTGLGLTITHQIIDAHNGRIDMKSQEGMGTSFTITLPI
ncbi:MAG: ATP-binding protein, partial [Candidatus Poribacteria bacterium]